MAYLRCLDSNDPGNYLVMENGMIGVYRTVDGASRLFTPLTQMNTLLLQGGETSTIPGRYEELPKVFAHPSGMTVYNGGAYGVDQQIAVTNPTISKVGSKQYNIVAPEVTLSSVASSNQFIPIDFWYRNILENTQGTNKTWGPIYVPGVTGITVGAQIQFSQTKGKGYYYEYFMYYATTTFKVGISWTPTGTITWGTPVSATLSGGTTLYASVSSPGNYIWMNITASSLSSTYLANNLNGPPFPYYESYQFLGGTASIQAVEIKREGTLDCVVIGK